MRAYHEKLKAQRAVRASEDVGPAPLAPNDPIEMPPSNPDLPAAPTLPATQPSSTQPISRPGGRSLTNFMQRAATTTHPVPPSSITTHHPSHQPAPGEDQGTYDRRYRKPNAAISELLSQHKSPQAAAAEKTGTKMSSSPFLDYAANATATRANGSLLSSPEASYRARGTPDASQKLSQDVLTREKSTTNAAREPLPSSNIGNSDKKKAGKKVGKAAAGTTPARGRKPEPSAAVVGVPIRRRKRARPLIIDDSDSEEESKGGREERRNQSSGEEEESSDLEEDISTEDTSDTSLGEEDEEQPPPRQEGRKRRREQPTRKQRAVKVPARSSRKGSRIPINAQQGMLSLDELLVAEEDTLASTTAAAASHGGAGGSTAPAAAAVLAPPLTDEDFVLLFDEYGQELPADTLEDDVYLGVTVPASIAKFLRPYQRTGIKFLLKNYVKGQGALLADDMGLGKTLQSIAFLAAVLGKCGDPLVDRTTPELTPLDRIVPVPPGNATAGNRGTGTCAGGGAVKRGGGRLVAEDDDYSPDYSQSAPALIVCPASLIDNWGNEFSRWGTFRIIKLRGGSVEAGVASILAGQYEVAIVSYETLRTKVESMAAVPWHVVILDEAHRVKNPKAGITIAVDRLPTRLRYGLSGTPMANDYDELYCLMEVLVPGRLGSKSKFGQEIVRPIKLGLRSGGTDDQNAEGLAAQLELQRVLRPLMLRRSKAIIAHQMPKKADHVVFCQLAPLQLNAYRRALKLPDVQLILKAREPCPCSSGDSIIECASETCQGFWHLSYNQGGVLYPHYHECDCDNPYDPISNPKGCKNHRPNGCWRQTKIGLKRMCPYCLIMPLITLLRKISLHLDLVKASPEDERVNPRKYEWDREVAGAIFGTDAVALGGEVQTARHLDLVDLSSCGKLSALKALLSGWAADAKGSKGRPHKVLIFSNSVRMLKIVQKMSDNAGWENLFMTGETPSDQRQQLVDQFNSPSSTAFLFITSTPAGGVGLNLVGANRVVILDPSYSPAADLQAMDRAFRIGQSRDVAVYRLVAAGTIEELIYMRQMSKQQHSMVAVEGDAAQKRIFAGAKSLPGMKGELWGFENLLGTLLKEAEDVQGRDNVQAMNVVAAAEGAENDQNPGNNNNDLLPAAQRGITSTAAATIDSTGVGDEREARIGRQVESGPGFLVEEVPEEIVAAMELTNAAAAATAGGTAGGGSAGGATAGGVEGTTRSISATAIARGGASGSRSIDNIIVGDESKISNVGDPGDPGDQDEDGFDPGLAALLQGINAPGVLGVVRHDAAMAPSKKAGAARKEAMAKKVQKEVREEAKVVEAVARSAPPGTQLECLAAWQGWSVRDIAVALMEMTVEERVELKERYKKEAPQGLMPNL